MRGKTKMLRMTTYYRVSLALPLVVPLGALAVEASGTALRPGMTTVMWYSLLIGGIPYLSLAGFMFYWIKGKPEKTIHQVIYLSPFFMVILIGVAAGVWPMLRGGSPAHRSLLNASAAYGAFVLGIGYLYVAIVQLVYLGLRAMKWIAVDEQAP